MKIVTKKLDELKKPEKNIRRHTEAQLKEYVRSVEAFGQIRPMVIDEDNVILAGNGLYEAMLMMGKTEGECYQVSGLTSAQKKKLMLADNRVQELGITLTTMIDEFFQEIGDYDIPGYSEDMLQVLLADNERIVNEITEYGVFHEPPKDTISMLQQPEKEHIVNTGVEGNNAYANVPIPTPIKTAPVSTTNAGTTNDSVNEPQKDKGERFIVCPHCGEKIWL